MLNPKKAIAGAVKEVKKDFQFVKSVAQKTKKTLMTEPDRTEGGKYQFTRVGNQIIRTKNPKY